MGGYDDLGNFEESQFSYRRTRNVDTMSQCASLFTQACGLRRSATHCLTSFCLLALLAFSSATLPKTAKTRVIFPQKPCKITTDNLASLKKYKFGAKNFLPTIDGLQSEVSVSFAQFGKMPSEVSDAPTQFWKVPSEPSDMSAQFRNTLSETSDTSTQFRNTPSEIFGQITVSSGYSVNNSRVLGRQSQAVLGKGEGLGEEKSRFGSRGFFLSQIKFLRFQAERISRRNKIAKEL